MKIKYLGFVFFALLIIFGTISCGGTPAPAVDPPPPPGGQEPPPAGGPTQEMLSNLNNAVLRTDNARKLVMDFNGPTFFPSDWASAENIYNRAQGLGRATADAVSQAIPLYNQAAAAYDALAEKTIPAYKQDLEDKVMEAREEAIDKGALYYAPGYILKTDSFAIEALEQYDAKDYYKANDTGLYMLDSYKAITVGLKAYELRMDIEDLGLYYYDSVALDAADDIAFSALDDFENGDIASAKNKADDVLARYEQSFAGTIQDFALDMRFLAAAEQARAQDARADVAVKPEDALGYVYDDAYAIFVRGMNAQNDRDFEKAARDYKQSRDMFFAMTELALEKRLIAEEAMREADSRVEDARLLLQGGVQ